MFIKRPKSLHRWLQYKTLIHQSMAFGICRAICHEPHEVNECIYGSLSTSLFSPERSLPRDSFPSSIHFHPRTNFCVTLAQSIQQSNFQLSPKPNYFRALLVCKRPTIPGSKSWKGLIKFSFEHPETFWKLQGDDDPQALVLFHTAASLTCQICGKCDKLRKKDKRKLLRFCCPDLLVLMPYPQCAFSTFLAFLAKMNANFMEPYPCLTGYKSQMSLTEIWCISQNCILFTNQTSMDIIQSILPSRAL